MSEDIDSVQELISAYSASLWKKLTTSAEKFAGKGEKTEIEREWGRAGS